MLGISVATSGSSREPPSRVDREVTWGLILAALVAFRLCLMPLASSLDTDETGTYWVIQHSLSETIARAVFWPPQPILYCVIAWVAKQIGGVNELALRMPSVLGMAAAVFLLFRLATRLADRRTAAIAIVVLLCFQPVDFASADARPYALALAASLAATLLLVRWLESGRIMQAVGYAICTAFMIHMQFLFGALLLFHAGYAAQNIRRRKTADWRSILLTCLFLMILLTPLAPTILSTVGVRGTLVHVASPHLGDIMTALLPPTVTFAALAGTLFFYLAGGDVHYGQVPGNRATFLFAAGWALVPILVLFAVSLLTHTSVFAPRYLLSAAPGLALLFALGIRGIEPGPARHFVLILVAGVSLATNGALTHFRPSHGSHDWRGVVSAVRTLSDGGRIPVLFQSPFVEAADPRQFLDPARRDMLLAPLSFYPLEGDVILLPDRYSDAAVKYLVEVTSRTLEPSERFLLVISEGGSPFREWLEGRLPAFQSKSIESFGDLTLTEFDRRHP